MRIPSSVGCVVAVMLVGCGQEAQDAQPHPEPSTAAATAPAKAPAKAPTKAEPAAGGTAAAAATGPGYSIQTSAAGPYRSGELGQFGITLTARDGYHVNQEYPIRVSITAPSGVAVPKAELERGDAAQFNDDVARFDVPFTPSAAGTHRLQALVDFAVCTPETCVPEQQTVAVALGVQ